MDSEGEAIGTLFAVVLVAVLIALTLLVAVGGAIVGHLHRHAAIAACEKSGGLWADRDGYAIACIYVSQRKEAPNGRE